MWARRMWAHDWTHLNDPVINLSLTVSISVCVTPHLTINHHMTSSQPWERYRARAPLRLLLTAVHLLALLITPRVNISKNMWMNVWDFFALDMNNPLSAIRLLFHMLASSLLTPHQHSSFYTSLTAVHPLFLFTHIQPKKASRSTQLRAKWDSQRKIKPKHMTPAGADRYRKHLQCSQPPHICEDRSIGSHEGS